MPNLGMIENFSWIYLIHVSRLIATNSCTVVKDYFGTPKPHHWVLHTPYRGTPICH